MGINWDFAPEGTTHAIEGQWRRMVGGIIHYWCEISKEWNYLGPWDECSKGFRYREKPKNVTWETPADIIPEVALDAVRSMAVESGMVIEFSSDGDVYVWDSLTETGTMCALDEVRELVEAKKRYLEVWCKFNWE